ncbi:hypothetical protein IVB27_33075 [Bradyrhizobium sp. 197]|uniref:hypothetical protein n=1 Tax=Bradyrhizobium sp. 197 TaxID=2782663 RepID=UPI001FF882BD|nr:hypothetical protein [Bradyrhizobium sp. 197]MCK1479448.1 hypothetical protein [Bradyrhizobium sp. 197]
MFTPHLSVVDGYLSGSRVRLGLTARGFIDGVDFARIEENKKLAPDALRRLQMIDRKAFKARHSAIFKAWITNLIPDADPDGKAVSAAQKRRLLDYCELHHDEFFDACPSLAVEDAMTVLRTADPRRKPQASDGIDLMHAVIALAYCDYFLVRDGYVKTCAVQSTKALSPRQLARVFDDPATLLNELKPPGAVASPIC